MSACDAPATWRALPIFKAAGPYTDCFTMLQGAWQNGSLVCNPQIGSPVCKADRGPTLQLISLWMILFFLLERIRAFL